MMVGQVLGPFEITRELGSGAMGAVFLARYTKTGVLVAIKVMNASLGANERAQARFEREADMLKQLRHPNIVRLLATGKYKKSPFYAMEFIEGENLDEILRRRERIPWEEVVEIGKQVCAALQHAHAAGIVHRDLKPSNLMVTEDGEVKLTDFGIAKDLDVTGLTTANHTVGTASYMSPEQCRGERDLTFKSDLYSLGIVFYELLTGRKPFIAENVMDMFMLHVNGRFERPSRIVFDMPVWLDTLVCQLLEKKPEHRPQDAAMVASVLGEIRAKAETLKSAGADAATKVARHSTDSTDKFAAKALLASGKRKKKKKAGMSKKSKEWWFTFIGLSLFLMVLAGIMTYVLWPNPAAELADLRKEYDKWEVLMDKGEHTDAQAKAYDLDEKLKRLARNTQGQVREEAKQLADTLEAGSLYVKVARMVRDKTWEQVQKQSGIDFDETYSQLLRQPPENNKYTQRGRELVQPLEAPALLAEGRELAAAKEPSDWTKARAKLDLLKERYPDADEAVKAQRTLDRLTAMEMERTIIVDWEERKKQGKTFQGLSEARTLATQAIDAEQHNKLADADALWKRLAELSVAESERSLTLLAKHKLKQLND